MSKILNLEVKLNFSDKIVSDDDIKIIINNVANAIQLKSLEDSITPYEIDAYTKLITVSCPLNGETTTRNT